MNLKHLPILELRHIYVDNLSEWIDIPVFDQDQVIKLVNEIDWDGLDMRQYKRAVVEHWHGLSPGIKSQLRNPTVQDELYEALVRENWGLSPGKAMGQAPIYTDGEAANVQLWFVSNKVKGRPPRVLNAN